MKKYENIYRIMNYAFKKDRFTLQDLMTEFSISKSTALRYVKALEDIGVPLYSEIGRYGGYTILDTYKLPPVTFSPQEAYALFFAMKSLELLGAIPFQAEYGAIRSKFLDSVSPSIRSTLEQLNSRISFGTVKLADDCPMLEPILRTILKPSVVSIVYQTAHKRTERRIQPIGILAKYGQWYCPSWDLDKKEYRLFRCDRMIHLTVLDDQPLEWLQNLDLTNHLQLVHKSDQAIDYIITIATEGEPIYERSHYPNMSLEKRDGQDGQSLISGWIEPSEMDFLLQYCHQFGPYLLDIHPYSIKQRFTQQLVSIKERLGKNIP